MGQCFHSLEKIESNPVLNIENCAPEYLHNLLTNRYRLINADGNLNLHVTLRLLRGTSME